MKFIPLILLTILLQGCALFDFFKKPDNPIIPPEEVVNIDKEAITSCEYLDENITIVVFEESIQAYATLATKYASCAKRQETSIKLIKQLGNVK